MKNLVCEEDDEEHIFKLLSIIEEYVLLDFYPF